MTPSSTASSPGPGKARDDDWIRALRTCLLAFFDEHARDLPWRRTGDPYAIWVSEIMLQQTRVETVIPYWERWMERYPTPQSLAEAPREEVLKAWEGLGYYSRARNLHRAAAVVREEHGGRLPDTVEGLRSLPGVGAYTAGAVASIAFGIAAPAVDGNVRRVAARLLDWPDPSPSRLEAVVGTWVPRSGHATDANPAGDFNQALMELGATVCTPRNPGCYTCPVADLCAAEAAGTVAERPAPKKRARVREEERVVDVRVRLDRGADAGHGGSGGAGVPGGAEGLAHPARTPWFLLRKRPPEGLLAGMYEFPSEVVEPEAGGGTDRPAEAVGRPLLPVDHAFTHLRVTYRPVLRVVEEQGERARGGESDGTQAPDAGGPAATSSPDASDPAGAARDWYPLHEVRELPLPVAQQKILALALEALEQPEL